MPGLLVDSLATTPALSAMFDDAAVLRALLDVETGLAEAEAEAGLIPPDVASAIARVAPAQFDVPALTAGGRSSGTIIVPFVRALTHLVGEMDAQAARFVHWGVTSQDISDNALLLLLTRSRPILARDEHRLEQAARALSETHAATLMAGRTLLRQATPITFGLKTAGWYAALRRSWRRLDAALTDAAVVQLGGAAGTLAQLGRNGPAVSARLASILRLSPADAPWHTHRDRLGAFVAACGIHAAVIGKIARDVSLLMQDETAEAAEPGGESSAMPHKRNPAASAIALAAATRLPGLVAAYLTSMVQEHERAVGGWQAEWPTVTAALQTVGSSLSAMASALEELSVDAARMRANARPAIDGAIVEHAAIVLSGKLGREAAHAIVTEALKRAAVGVSVRDALAELPAVRAALTEEEIASLGDAERQPGSSEVFRQRLLST